MAKVRMSHESLRQVAANISVALMNRPGGDQPVELSIEPRGEAGVLAVELKGSDGTVIVQEQHLVVQLAR